MEVQGQTFNCTSVWIQKSNKKSAEARVEFELPRMGGVRAAVAG
jgi:hypothetical protein